VLLLAQSSEEKEEEEEGKRNAYLLMVYLTKLSLAWTL
jgi:hypothetical protein